ncbi:hypothetical protein BH23CHL3_BH23CHL3_10920 [soil metagenome]|jgi:hypothetical protein
MRSTNIWDADESSNLMHQFGVRRRSGYGAKVDEYALPIETGLQDTRVLSFPVRRSNETEDWFARIDKSARDRPADALRFEQELERLQQLAQLKQGWDGSDAIPLSPVAVAHAALTAYSVLSVYGKAPNFIAPIPDGGVQVEWDSGTAALELTIGQDGYKEILLVLNQDSKFPEVHEYGEALEASEGFDRALRMYFG